MFLLSIFSYLIHSYQNKTLRFIIVCNTTTSTPSSLVWNLIKNKALHFVYQTLFKIKILKRLFGFFKLRRKDGLGGSMVENPIIVSGEEQGSIPNFFVQQVKRKLQFALMAFLEFWNFLLHQFIVPWGQFWGNRYNHWLLAGTAPSLEAHGKKESNCQSCQIWGSQSRMHLALWVLLPASASER